MDELYEAVIIERSVEMVKLDRRHFLDFILKSAAITGVSGCASLPQKDKLKKRPNILFIMSDDHASHAISCYGSKINKTPNIDRIGKEGMIFENCFVTNSLCGPSRAVILTGKYSHVNGLIDNITVFDGSQETYIKIIRNAGYQTAMIGKWHLKSTPQGFDYWNVLPGQGRYKNPTFIEMGETKKYKGYVTDLITDFAVNFLDNIWDKKRPFCMHVHHKAPHRNWIPDKKHAHMYEDVEIPYPETFDDDYSTREYPASHTTMTVAKDLKDFDVKAKPPEGLTPHERKKWNYQRFIKDYLRCVASVDDNVGRLLNHLEKMGILDDTLIVYTSDQGFFLGDHGWFDKRFMYEESLRMPFLVRYPRLIKPGTRNMEIVTNVDFAPTFLDLAGADIPKDMQGKSIVPLLKGITPKNWRKAMYYHYYEYPAEHSVRRHYGIRTKRYKLIHFYYDVDAWELYDLKKDPHELHNVYNDPAYFYVRERLKKELQKLIDELGDYTVPSGKPLLPDFSWTDNVYIRKTKKGYDVSSIENGYALFKAATPYKNRVRFSFTAQCKKKWGRRNIIFAFGEEADKEDLIKCGLYIGSGHIVAIYGDPSKEKNIKRIKAKGLKSKKYNIEVNIDLENKSFKILVDGKEIEFPIDRNWNAVNYFGYAVFSTQTLFSKVKAEGS